ncbi:MAG: hypothetical protein KIT25_12410 [Enhydrobacter sp.]|nr:MAG: hypothetical protein KIT25_12410 [Enhydrobacter sp.]
MIPRDVARRTFLAATLLLPAAACQQTSDLFGRRTASTLSRGDRMVRWLQNSGRPGMMAPETYELMGIRNPSPVRDIPVRQITEEARDGRYAVSLVNIRGIHEFVFHRRQEELLIFHHSDTNFRRLVSVRYPRTGRPSIIQDVAFAENDFHQQVTFWFNRMPGR